MAVDRERVAALVRELLAAIGEDPERPGLRLTPQRVADAYAEFFSGRRGGCRRPSRAHDLGHARPCARDAALRRGDAPRHPLPLDLRAPPAPRSAATRTSPTCRESRWSGSAPCRRSWTSSRRVRRCRSAWASRSPTRSRIPRHPRRAGRPGCHARVRHDARRPPAGRFDRHDRRARRAVRTGRQGGVDRAARSVARMTTLIMGIVNVTPDSFSDGGRFLDPDAAIAHGLLPARRRERTCSTSAASPPGPAPTGSRRGWSRNGCCRWCGRSRTPASRSASTP